MKGRRSWCARTEARAGETFHPAGERTAIGRSPDCEVLLDDVTVSRQHAGLLVERDGQFYIQDEGSLNRTSWNRSRIEAGAGRRRRRDPDRQVPTDLPEPMTATGEASPAKRHARSRSGRCASRLQNEFPDISISKIRYLEDQGLLKPTAYARRLPALRRRGRRAPTRAILRLQRDEFLPLRVIQQELGLTDAVHGGGRRRPIGLSEEEQLTLADVCKRAEEQEEPAARARGVRPARTRAGTEKDKRGYGESDVEIASACAKLARFGIAPRMLRRFRTSAGQEASGGSSSSWATGCSARAILSGGKPGWTITRLWRGFAQELSQMLF